MYSKGGKNDKDYYEQQKFASGRKAISKGVNMRLAIECSWKGLFRYCQVGGILLAFVVLVICAGGFIASTSMVVGWPFASKEKVYVGVVVGTMMLNGILARSLKNKNANGKCKEKVRIL